MRHGTASNLAVLCCVEEERLLDATFTGHHRSFSERMCFLRSTPIVPELAPKLLRNHGQGGSRFKAKAKSLGLALEVAYLALAVFGVVLVDTDIPIGRFVL